MFAAYTRVSRVGDRAERLISPDFQAEKIQAYASAHELEVEMQEPELDQSGGKVERPILQRLIEGIEAGRYAGIIVAQLDRLSRMEIADALHTIRRIESCGGQVIAVAENFDASTPEGRMSRTMFLAMAEMQLQRYRGQFADAKRKAVENGIWPMPIPPVGYSVTRRKDGGDGRLYPDPINRAKVVKAFEARAAGKSWMNVADILGSSMTHAHKVIKNRVYLGELKLAEWRNPSAHEPIVPRDLWEAAQLDFPRRSLKWHGPALLTGLIRCAHCLRQMTVERGRANRYRCMPHNSGGRCPAPPNIDKTMVEKYVTETVLPHLKRITFQASPPSDELARAEDALRSAEAELDAFQTITRITDVGAEHFSEGLRTRVAEVERTRAVLAKQRVRVDLLPSGDLLREWKTMTVAEQGQVLRGALGVVLVWKGKGLWRVRLLESGYEPAFPERGSPIIGVEWQDTDFPGELRPASTQNLAEGSSGTIS